MYNRAASLPGIPTDVGFICVAVTIAVMVHCELVQDGGRARLLDCIVMVEQVPLKQGPPNTKVSESVARRRLVPGKGATRLTADAMYCSKPSTEETISGVWPGAVLAATVQGDHRRVNGVPARQRRHGSAGVPRTGMIVDSSDDMEVSCDGEAANMVSRSVIELRSSAAYAAFVR